MIKYSFGDDEEYVAVKEDEYDDLTNTSKDAIHAYQEIFRMMDEGWMLIEAPGYGILVFSRYDVLDLVPLWSLVKCRHRYAVSSLMDTAY
ncbi:hypothetical protein Tco_0951146 [Tanacetum coccineum]|uniref:Uncharacterized protein n=1 Tax=Tanacetum coccineum TaxID=301880 RepID=A0ABQ5DTB1_9ASTR